MKAPSSTRPAVRARLAALAAVAVATACATAVAQRERVMDLFIDAPARLLDTGIAGGTLMCTGRQVCVQGPPVTSLELNLIAGGLPAPDPERLRKLSPNLRFSEILCRWIDTEPNQKPRWVCLEIYRQR